MSDQKKPQKKTYTVTSAFVWDGGIKKSKATVELTATEAHGLIKRGKVEAPGAVKGKASAAKKEPAAKSGEGEGGAS
ncbi:hypothetical protein ACFMBG_07045 [Leisingera sp. D0M16]|uniref:hypothetical protein n=1 Tax=Leisingera coralii TaxID=3351347 RepID=UPI003B76CF37